MIKQIFSLFLVFILACCNSKKEPHVKFQEFEIGIVADCQYCNCETKNNRFYKQSSERLRKSVEELNTHNLDYAIHLGDFIDSGFQSFDTVLPIWNGLKSNKYHVLGNHDFSVSDSLKPLVFKKLNIKKRYYSILKNNWRFIVLDGNDLSFHGALTDRKKQETDSLFQLLSDKNRPNLKIWNGGLSSQQLKWVTKELQLATKNKERVGFYCHFPSLGEEQTHNLWNYEELLTLIDQYPCVKFYFNGHNHNGGYVQKNGVHYLNFKGMVDTQDSTSFATVNFRKDSLFINGYGREPSRKLKIK